MVTMAAGEDVGVTALQGRQGGKGLKGGLCSVS